MEKIAKYVVKDEENPEEFIESFIKEKENIDIGQRDTMTNINEDNLEDNIINKDKKEEGIENIKNEKYEPPKDLIKEEKEEKEPGENKNEAIEVKDDKKEGEKNDDEKKE